MTLIWFIVWFILNTFFDQAPIRLDPVNAWAGFLLLAIALDLSAAQARASWSGRRRG